MIRKFLILMLMVIVISPAFEAIPTKAAGEGWLSGYDERIQIDNTEVGGGTISSYTVQLEAFYNCAPVNSDSLTQFLYRPAYHYSGTHDRTYFGNIDQSGNINFQYWDEDDQIISDSIELWNSFSGNDHDGLSIIVLQNQTGGDAVHNGKILTVATNYDAGIYTRRTDNAEDISSWGNSVTVTSGVSHAYAYAKLIERSDGTIMLFYRDLDTTHKIFYRILTLGADSDDDTWSAATEFADLGPYRTYYALYQEDSDIHFAFQQSEYDPGIGQHHDIWYIKFQESDDTWRTQSGTQKSLPFDLSDADHTPEPVYTSTVDHSTYLWDITTDGLDNPHILFIDTTSVAENALGDIYTASYSSGWSTTDTTINSILLLSSAEVFTGAIFDEEEPTTIYACVGDGSNYAQLQKWDYSGTWTKTDDITQSAPGENFRPSHVINGSGSFEILWFYTERYEGITNWEAMEFAYPGLSNGKYISLNKNSRSDFGDLTFTQSNGTTLQPSASAGKPWIQEKVDYWRAVLWINVGTVPAAGGTLTNYLYWDNPSDTNDNDQIVMDAQFQACDHFDDGAGNPNSDKWDLVDGAWPQLDDNSQILLTGSVVDYATIDQDTVNNGAAMSAPTATSGWELRAKLYGSDTTPGNAVGLRDAAGDWTERTRIAQDPAVANAVDLQSYKNSVSTITDDSPGWDIANTHIWVASWIEDENIFYIDNYLGSSATTKTRKGFTVKATHNTNVSDEDGILVLNESSSASGVLYVDWVFVRALTDPEPTTATSQLSEPMKRLVLYIDGVEKDAEDFPYTISDNESDWIFAANGSVMYMDSGSISINGTSVSAWTWEYGATFQDSIGSNDATPTFRITSSDSDISANLTSFGPISEATAPTYTVTDPTAFVSGTPNITGNFTTSLDPSFPGSDIVEETADEGGMPVQMPFIWLSVIGLVSVSFLTSWMATKVRSNSILPKILLVGILLGALVGLKVFDFWMLLYLVVLFLAFAIAKTHTTWGGESGYNMAGFLAMSFVGMTIINRIMEGAFLSSTDTAILNNVLVFRPVNVFGLFQISVPNLSFLTSGLPHLIRWDYSFFGGNAVIIQYLFYSITAFMAFLLFIIMLGVVFNMLSRSR